MKVRPGFTLTELLMVMMIIAILMAMLMPAYSIIRQSMRKNATVLVIKKTETALRLFQGDWSVLPGQMAYPADPADLTNRLYHHVGTDIDATRSQEILADAKAAAGLFDYAVVGEVPAEVAVQPSPLTYVKADIALGSEPRSTIDFDYRESYCNLLNRMGAERIRLAAMSGNLWLRGPVIAASSTAAGITITKSAHRFFPAPASAGAPGWANDYLGGELEARYRSGDSILDAWGRPLVYICQQIPGVLGTNCAPWNARVAIRDNRRYGLGPIGFDATQGPGPSIAATRPHLLYTGRIIISKTDAGDGRGPTPTDASTFPSLSTPLHSDVRYYATVRFARDFELWSRGPDQRFAYLRDDQANRDNVSATPYHRDY